MISNRCARKSLVTNCNSTTSKNYLRFLVDSNDFDCHSNCPILFLGLYDRGECRIFAFLVNLEDGCCMWAYSDLGNYDGGSGDDNM